MSVHRPQDVDMPDTGLATEPDSPGVVAESDGPPYDDADRDVVEHDLRIPSQRPDDVDPGDFYEQSLVVEYDDDDYR